MKKLYPVMQYSESAWSALCESDDHEVQNDVVTVVWKKKAVCLDIMASGQKVVYILRRLEASLQAVGLSGSGKVYDGWFGAWADSLTSRTDRKYFIWSYDGKEDAKQGRWSYSWSVERIDDDQWYIFLNLARESSNNDSDDHKEEENKAMKNQQNNVTVEDKIRAAFEDAKQRLFSGEDMHVHFSEGNSKTHMPSLDLLPLFTCHGRCRSTCGYIKPGRALPDCYAAKIANRFPGTLRNYAENTVLAIYRPDQYWAEVRAKMRLSRFMRLFVSGDAIIAGYFSRLCDALEDNPHLEMQGFSKCYEIVNREIERRGALPKNLHLLLSGWGDMTPVNPYNLPTTNVYDHERPEGWLSCGGNCANCACVGLGCWKASAGDVVGFKKH